MAPRIQYARTSDGVSIGFTVLGNGPPLVFTTAAVFGNLVGDMQLAAYRSFMERLARSYTVVLYDGRAGGSSDPAEDLSLEGHVRDIEAVVDRLGFDSFSLFGFYHTSLAAIVYAARHPEKVRKMILWHSYAAASDLTSPQIAAIRSIRDTSWEVFTETLARTLFGWGNDQEASRWARMIRDATTPEQVARWIEFQRAFDVSQYLAGVRCPTLVAYRKDARRFSADRGIALASQIAGAQLQLLPGDAMMYFAGDSDRIIQVIEDFLGDGMAASFQRSHPGAGSIVTILFAEVAGLGDAMGEQEAGLALQDIDRAIRDSLRRHGSNGVKDMAGGVMASFGSAHAALECAIEVQRAIEGAGQPEEGRAHIKIGLNAGEPAAGNDDLFGSAVVLAARAASKAGPAEIFVTDVVRQLAAGKGFLFSDMGETEMRGFEDPVRLFQLRWRPE